MLTAHRDGTYLKKLGPCRDPEACRLACNDGFRGEAVQEALPVPGENLMECALSAAHIFVERCKVRLEVLASAGGPHEQAERAFEVLSIFFDFASLCS